jgi:hypothetical protein
VSELADQINALATPTDVVKPDPQSKPGEDYPLQSAQEIESGMAYTGMDDVIRDLADKVRERDETATTMERLAGEGYSVQVEFWYGALDNVAWHCNLWEGRVADVVRPYKEADFVVPYGLVGAGKGETLLQAVLKAEGSAKGTMTQQSVGMPGPGEPT